MGDTDIYISVPVISAFDLVSQTAEFIGESVELYLALNARCDLLYLIVRKVNADNAFYSFYRIILEFLSEILVILDLVNEFIDLCLDVHNMTSFLNNFPVTSGIY